VSTETFHLDSPAEQAARRRAQLTRVVAHIVVSHGVAAVSHASVAEVAGCARSLVYRYFPQRADLLFELLVAFEADLDARFSFDELIEGVLSLKDVGSEEAPAVHRRFVERLWAPGDWEGTALELRLATVILLRDSSLNSVLGPHRAILQGSMEQRLLHPLESLGLTRIQAWIVVDAMLSVLHHVTRAVLVGESKPEEALDLLRIVSARMLQTFVA
jgi:AcrR family transcriptional regulator